MERVDRIAGRGWQYFLGTYSESAGLSRLRIVEMELVRHRILLEEIPEAAGAEHI